jgi:uracil-DNA glycosylase family 4
MDSKAYKHMLLENLYTPYHQCQECPLGSLGRTNVVFGQGNPDAKLMFIGEGPGRDEDMQGLPFVGRSGQLLNHILEAVNIKREDVFITNIVKCRPPNNRQPLPHEMAICKKILLEHQIKIIRPSLICTLGAAALQGLMEQQFKITQIHGQLLTYHGIKLIPTYHPAYILRNPRELNSFADDLTCVVSLVK